MKRVLLIVNNQAFSGTMLRWEQILRQAGKWEPVVFNTVGDHLAAQVEAMQFEGPQMVLHPPALGGWKGLQQESDPIHAETEATTWRRWLKKVLPAWMTKIYNVSFKLRANVGIFSVLRRQIRFIRELIQREQIDLLMISDSSPAYDAPIYVRAARCEGIPIVVAPTECWASRDYAEGYLTDSTLLLNHPMKRLVGKLYPRWVIKHKGSQLLRIQLPMLLAQEWLGIGSPQPWQMVGAWEDSVAATNENMYEFYLREGVTKDLLTIVGSPEQDIMADVLRNITDQRAALCKELGIPAGRPILLSALVQSHFLSGRTDAEFQSYSEMVEAWVRPLAAIRNFNVVISLHPSHSMDRMRYIEDWGVKITQRDLATLIPLCDIYVASISSTIPWAIACGKPVVNYDVYRFSPENSMWTYPDANGTLTVVNHDDYVQVLERLTSDPDFLSDLSARQSACATRWGKLDGKAGEHLLQLFDDMVEKYKGEEIHAR